LAPDTLEVSGREFEIFRLDALQASTTLPACRTR
jgi:hypothetical protein